MVSMNKLFTQRRQRHFMMLLRYWRLVFNDHFVIALFFLFGALAYGYSQWLPRLGPHLWWTRWVLVIWFTVFAQLGRLATLLERPDPIFLLPQVGNMQKYLRQASHYSLFLAEIISLVGAFVALPFALTTEYLSNLAIVGIFITALFNKASWLKVAQTAISQQWSGHRYLIRLEYWGVPLISSLVMWLVNPLAGAAVAIIIYAGLVAYYRHLTLDWTVAVASEQDRMYSVYRFFNLFTDVPKVQGNVKRRTWANGLLSLLTISGHPWSYLYARGFVRNTDVSGIVIRLTILGMVVSFLVPVTWLNSVLVVLFIYLIATQLMPLFDQYDGNVFTHLYPVSFRERQADFQNLLVKITSIEMALIVVASIGIKLDWQRLLLNLVLGVVEVFLLTCLYFRVRIKKLSEEY